VLAHLFHEKFRHPAILDHYLTVASEAGRREGPVYDQVEHPPPGLPRVEVYLISRWPKPTLNSWAMEADRTCGFRQTGRAGLARDWAAAIVDALILGWHTMQPAGTSVPSSPKPQPVSDSDFIERLAIEGVFDEQLHAIRNATQFDNFRARLDDALRLPKSAAPASSAIRRGCAHSGECPSCRMANYEPYPNASGQYRRCRECGTIFTTPGV
jgi:hypothetical protein